MTERILIFLAVAGLLLSACDDDDDECPDCVCDCCAGDDDAGDDDTAAECGEDAECAEYEICDEGLCVDGDRNNDFTEADAVAEGADLYGYINPAGDIDYFRLNGGSGEFFKAYALTETSTEEGGLDTLVRFYDGSGGQLGSNDDFERMGHIYGTDAVYMGCTPASSTYFLSVEDAAFGGGPSYVYNLLIAQFESGAVEDEPNDEVSDAHDAAVAEYDTNYDRAGIIEDDGDVDLWLLQLEPGARLRVYGYENTATEMDTRLRLLGTDGTSQVVEFDDPSWSDALAVPILDADAVYLEVTDQGDDGGDDYCYVLHFAADPAGELYWAETEPNDNNLDSESLQANDEGVLSVAGRIDPVVDLDHFVFQGTAGEAVTVTFAARSAGSQLQAHLVLTGPDDSELTALDVPITEGEVIEGLALPSTGTYHLEVTSADLPAAGVDHWYTMSVEMN